MRSRRESSDKLSRLDDLAAAPTEQVSYALKLLETEKGLQVVQAALRVLADNPHPGSRSALLRQYAYRDADGNKRDPGGYVRSEILKILRPVARPEDVPLLERAAQTYEFMPGADEVCSSIRANALIALNEIVPDLASYHCVRLLVDQHASEMSGEPAVTAARILASQSRVLPLYAYASGGGRFSEVISESLRNLTRIPRSLLPPIVEKFSKTDDEIVLVGLFDLILGHEAGASFDGFVIHFLRTTHLHDVHRYLVTAIVANRKKDLVAHLIEIATDEKDRRKQEDLVEALSLLKGDKAVEAAVSKLRAQLQR